MLKSLRVLKNGDQVLFIRMQKSQQKDLTKPKLSLVELSESKIYCLKLNKDI